MNSNTGKSLSHILFTARLAVALILCAMFFSCGTSKKVSVQQSPVNSQITVTKNIGRKTPHGKQYDVDHAYADRLIAEARKWTGTPYVFGGTTREGTDCSGFMMTLFNETLGVVIPRNSRKQGEYCMSVERNRLQPGDLVFFTGRSTGGEIGHVGMYIGDNKIIHSSSSRGVIESSLDEKYYVEHLHSYGRVEAITYAVTDPKKNRDITAPEIIPTPAKAPAPDIFIAETAPVSVDPVRAQEPATTVFAPVQSESDVISMTPESELIAAADIPVPAEPASGLLSAQSAPVVSDIFDSAPQSNLAQKVEEPQALVSVAAETVAASSDSSASTDSTASEIDDAVRNAFAF